MMIMSLKWRMALLTTAVVAVILVAFNSFVYIEFMQATIQTEQVNLDAMVVQLKDRWRDESSLTQAKHDLLSMIGKHQLVRFLLSDGTELIRVTNDFRDSSLPKALESPASDGFYPIGREHMLVVQKPAKLLNHEGIIQIVESVQDLDRSIGFVFGLLVTGSAGALVLTIVGAYWLSERWLRPVQRIISTVQSIDGRELGRRLPEPSMRDEVGELARTFNAMLERIEFAFERQQQFVADASHELRTPLSILEGYANILRRWGKEDPDIRAEAVGAIVAETARLRTLTNHLLDLASVEHLEMLEAERVSVCEAIERVVGRSAVLNPSVQLTWSIGSDGGDSWIMMHQQSLDRMLTALVDNALKYTAEGGHVHVSCKRVDGWIVIHVEDTGIGIPQEEVERVFERFYRVEKSRNRMQGGAGLGLSICREIVARCKGQISISSALGEGTVVTVTLPSAEEIIA